MITAGTATRRPFRRVPSSAFGALAPGAAKIVAGLALVSFPVVQACSAGGVPEGRGDVTLLYTADAQGYLEACACETGGKLGGIARRAALVDSLRGLEPGTLLVEAGDFATGPGAHGELVGLIAARAMARMKYDAILPGEVELNLGPAYWEKVAKLGLPFVHTNFGTHALGKPQFEPLVLERLGRRVAVLGLLGPDLYFLPATKAGLEIVPPADAVRIALEKLQGKQVDAVVALVHMRTADVERVADQYPQIDVIVAGHTSRNLQEPERRGSALLVSAGFLGQHLGVLRLSGPRLETARNSVVRLETTMPEDEAIARWVGIAARR